MKIPSMHMGVEFHRCDECEYKRDASLRDDLLVTAGARAAYMHDKDVIDIPDGVEGEAELARFITNRVYYYLAIDERNFDNYIESALISKYGGKNENLG